ncbi:MAG: hypothetical protein NZ805_05030 [Armatimonadetes bacterium]|nr:hypothetical protein [Armatimonadota bacterium]MDW8028815.1 hypothetical protein [Armatimonadota bacterium]
MQAAAELWQRMKPIIRQRMTFTPDGWRSVEAAVPIAIEGDTFVLGLSPENENLRPYLETQTMMALIREILMELTNEEMKVIVIPGTTEDDWKRYKFRQDYIRRLSTQTVEVSARQEREHRDWMWLTNQIAHAHAHLPHRQYDFVKARFLLDWSPKIAEFVEEFLASNPGKQEDVIKELERVCQRIAGMLNTSAFVVGLEIEKAIRERSQKRSE